MGGLFEAIGDFIGDVVGAVVDFIGDVLDAAWQFLIDKIIEPVMNFLGFTDEDIYSTDVIAIRVFNEDLYKKTQQDLALEYMHKGYSSLEYSTNFSKTGDAQFGKYYRHGKWDYLDYLPDAQINAVSIDVSTVKDILAKKHNDDVFIVNIEATVPNDEVWVKYLLQEQLGYNVGTDTLVDDNTQYKYASVHYDANSNKFVVTMTTISEVIVYTYETTDVTIEGTHTIHCGDGSHVGQEGVYCGTVLDTIKITKSRYELHNRADTGSVIYETEPVIISVSYDSAESGTVIPSSITELVDTKIEIYEPITKEYIVENHDNTRRYVVEYTTQSNGHRYLWIYSSLTHEYPSLDTPVEKIINFDMYPVTMVRNAFFNVRDYDKNEINGESRPPTVTKERYEDTVDLLGSIGVSLDDLTNAYAENPDIDKIQDAFLLMGVSPSDTHPIVSKALWEIFDFVYDRIPFVDSSSAYSAAFREDPYNAAIMWVPKEATFKEERIGSLGTCKHVIESGKSTTKKYHVTKTTKIGNRKYTITTYDQIDTYHNDELLSSVNENTSTKTVSGYYSEGTERELISNETNNAKDILITKQITETTTKTIYVLGLTSINIIRRGVKNGGVSLEADDKDLIIPLPVPVVERLTLMEKTALLGRSVHLLFYAFEHTHLEWYETEKFMGFINILMIVIVIVITIVSWGTLTWEAISWYSAMMAALEAIAVYAAVQLALKLIIKYVDNIYLKMALSAVVMALGAWYGGAFESFDLLTAVQMANMTVELANMYVGDMNGVLQEDMQSFSKEYGEKSTAYGELISELNSGISVSDVTDLMVNSDIIATTMSPSQFITMSVDGYRNFDMLYSGLYDTTVHDFVKNKKRLGITGDE